MRDIRFVTWDTGKCECYSGDVLIAAINPILNLNANLEPSDPQSWVLFDRRREPIKNGSKTTCQAIADAWSAQMKIRSITS